VFRSLLTAGVLVAVAATVPFTPAEAVSAKAKTYKNCTALNKVYPHGVGKPGAVDKTSGKRVTNFKKSTDLYNANKKSDRDGDKIACEKR